MLFLYALCIIGLASYLCVYIYIYVFMYSCIDVFVDI